MAEMAKMASTIADVVLLSLLLLSLADVAALSSTLRLRLDQLDARASRNAPARSALTLWNACGTSWLRLRFQLRLWLTKCASCCWGGRSPPSFGCNWNAVCLASTAQRQRISLSKKRCRRMHAALSASFTVVWAALLR